MRIILIFILAGSFSARADNCGVIKIEMERLVCRTPELTGLDKELNAAYAKARAGRSPNELKFLLSEQRQWVKSKNQPPSCERSNPKQSLEDCQILGLKETYQRRLATLEAWWKSDVCPAILAKGKDVKPAVMSDETKDLKIGAKFIHIDLKEQGTMHASQLEMPAANFVRDEGINSNVVEYHGDYFEVLSSRRSIERGPPGSNPAFARWSFLGVSLISPRGFSVRLCEMEAGEALHGNTDLPARDTLVFAKDAALCADFQKGSFQSVDWKYNAENLNLMAAVKPDSPEMEVAQGLFHAPTSLIVQKYAYVDLSGDGVKRRFVQFDLSSGAGSGCDFRGLGLTKGDDYFAPLLPNSGMSPVDVKLAKTLYDMNGGLGCRGGELGLVQVHDRKGVFLRGYLPTVKKGLYGLKDGVAEEICKISIVNRNHVQKFTGDGKSFTAEDL